MSNRGSQVKELYPHLPVIQIVSHGRFAIRLKDPLSFANLAGPPDNTSIVPGKAQVASA